MCGGNCVRNFREKKQEFVEKRLIRIVGLLTQTQGDVIDLINNPGKTLCAYNTVGKSVVFGYLWLDTVEWAEGRGVRGEATRRVKGRKNEEG